MLSKKLLTPLVWTVYNVYIVKHGGRLSEFLA